MNVLVTGVSGFLGFHVMQALRQAGHQVRALLRRETALAELPNDVEAFFADLGSESPPATVWSGVDAVVHCAGLVKAAEEGAFYRVNLGGTARLLEASQNRSLRRFVHISTIAVDPAGETAPISHYGKSKRAAEDEVQRYASRLPVTILRPPALYGPRDREFLSLFRLVRKGLLPSLGSARHQLKLLFVEDCASAVVRSLTQEHASGSVYSLEDGHTYTQGELARTVAAVLGVKGVEFTIPTFGLQMVATVEEIRRTLFRQPVMLTTDKAAELLHPGFLVSSAAIRNELGWVPTYSLTEGAQKTAEWYKSKGWLS